MRAFCELYDQLDRASGTKARVAALVSYFQRVPPADAAWALRCLLGKQRKRLITGRRLREICLAGTHLPDWLFEDCYSHVGDTAETIALLWRGPTGAGPIGADPTGADPTGTASAADPSAEAAGKPLHHWMERTLPAVAALEGEAQAEAVRELWNGLPTRELLVFNKLLTGGFRVGVAQGLVVRALAQVSGLEEPLLSHRLMGGFQPSAAAFEALLAPGEGDESALSRPYPFFLASPLEPERLHSSPPQDWWVEWKWDGIRGQLIQRKGETFLWSRGEELINASFPELIERARALPDGTVLDGEVIVWPPGADRPQPFADLQRRLGRTAPGAALLKQCPADFVAYDLLEADGLDLRTEPLERRRELLMALAAGLDGLLRVSPLLPLPGWDAPGRAARRGTGRRGRGVDAQGAPFPLPGRSAAGPLVEAQAGAPAAGCGAALCPGGQRSPGQPVHRLHLCPLDQAQRLERLPAWSPSPRPTPASMTPRFRNWTAGSGVTRSNGSGRCGRWSRCRCSSWPSRGCSTPGATKAASRCAFPASAAGGGTSPPMRRTPWRQPCN